MAEHMRIEHTGAGRRGLYQWVDAERWMILDAWSKEIRAICTSKEDALQRIKGHADNSSMSIGDCVIVRMDVIAPYLMPDSQRTGGSRD